MARSFFYACAGVLCLAGAYAIGARSAVAAPPRSADESVWVSVSAFGGGEIVALSRDNGVYLTTIEQVRKMEPAYYIGTLMKRPREHQADPYQIKPR